jgi:hypothetical protein
MLSGQALFEPFVSGSDPDLRERSVFLQLEISNFNTRSNLITFSRQRLAIEAGSSFASGCRLPIYHHSVGRGVTCGWKAARPVKTEHQRTCPSCGSDISGAMEFCPVCMLRLALAGGVESGESSASEDPNKPSARSAQRFEHYELVKGEDGNRSSWAGVQWGSLRKRSTSICIAT